MKEQIAKTTIALAITSLLSACGSTSNNDISPLTYQCDPQMTAQSDNLRIYQIMVES